MTNIEINNCIYKVHPVFNQNDSDENGKMAPQENCKKSAEDVIIHLLPKIIKIKSV